LPFLHRGRKLTDVIYLVRHGQTEFNLARRHHGHTDSSLTELGRDQARRAGAVLAVRIDPNDAMIFSSPLGRALDTARIIANVAAIKEPVVVDPDLMEIGMGSAEGMTELEMAARWPELQAHPEHRTMSFQSPDGESLHGLAKRLNRALRRVARRGAASRIIVSHGIAGRVLRVLHLGLDAAQAQLLDAPQDGLFRLSGSEVTRIAF
jgi:broad specificity phosphatase PhoE